jgi:hypothetical protein
MIATDLGISAAERASSLLSIFIFVAHSCAAGVLVAAPGPFVRFLKFGDG